MVVGRYISLISLEESSLNGKILSSVVKIWDDYYHDINHGLFRSDLVDNIIVYWRFTSPYDKRYRSVHKDVVC